jgi:hypothetical protein
MYGRGIPHLDVSLYNVESQQRTLLWMKFDDQGDAWHRAFIVLGSHRQRFQVEIAHAGLVNADTCLDDLTFTNCNPDEMVPDWQCDFSNGSCTLYESIADSAKSAWHNVEANTAADLDCSLPSTDHSKNSNGRYLAVINGSSSSLYTEEKGGCSFSCFLGLSYFIRATSVTINITADGVTSSELYHIWNDTLAKTDAWETVYRQVGPINERFVVNISIEMEKNDNSCTFFAIDDVQFFNSVQGLASESVPVKELAIPRESCDFEDGSCSFLFNVVDGDDGDWIVGDGWAPSLVNGPINDATLKSERGHYLYSQAINVSSNSSSKLTTVVYNTSSFSCRLSFAYNLHGLHVGQLDVYIDRGTGRLHAWTEKGNKGIAWQTAEVYIGYSTFPFHAAIVATHAAGVDDILALDDVSFKACTYDDNVCDWESEIGCLWWRSVETSEGYGMWERVLATDLQTGGETLRKTSGFVAYFNHSRTNAEAVLESVPLRPNNAWPNCRVSLSYYMHGNSSGELTVSQESKRVDVVRPVTWSGDQGDLWHTVDIVLAQINDDFSVRITAKGTAENTRDAAMALDNIQLLDCMPILKCPYDTADPNSTATAVISECWSLYDSTSTGNVWSTVPTSSVGPVEDKCDCAQELKRRDLITNVTNALSSVLFVMLVILMVLLLIVKERRKPLPDKAMKGTASDVVQSDVPASSQTETRESKPSAVVSDIGDIPSQRQTEASTVPMLVGYQKTSVEQSSDNDEYEMYFDRLEMGRCYRLPLVSRADKQRGAVAGCTTSQVTTATSDGGERTGNESAAVDKVLKELDLYYDRLEMGPSHRLPISDESTDLTITSFQSTATSGRPDVNAKETPLLQGLTSGSLQDEMETSGSRQMVKGTSVLTSRSLQEETETNDSRQRVKGTPMLQGRTSRSLHEELETRDSRQKVKVTPALQGQKMETSNSQQKIKGTPKLQGLVSRSLQEEIRASDSQQKVKEISRLQGLVSRSLQEEVKTSDSQQRVKGTLEHQGLASRSLEEEVETSGSQQNAKGTFELQGLASRSLDEEVGTSDSQQANRLRDNNDRLVSGRVVTLDADTNAANNTLFIPPAISAVEVPEPRSMPEVEEPAEPETEVKQELHQPTFPNLSDARTRPVLDNDELQGAISSNARSPAIKESATDKRQPAIASDGDKETADVPVRFIQLQISTSQNVEDTSTSTRLRSFKKRPVLARLPDSSPLINDGNDAAAVSPLQYTTSATRGNRLDPSVFPTRRGPRATMERGSGRAETREERIASRRQQRASREPRLGLRFPTSHRRSLTREPMITPAQLRALCHTGDYTEASDMTARLLAEVIGTGGNRETSQ